MQQKQQINEILSQAQKIRGETKKKIPYKIENYLNYQFLKASNEPTSTWTCKSCFGEKTKTEKQFRIAFDKMSRLEKAKFYAMNVKLLQGIFDEEDSKKQKNEEYHHQIYINEALVRDKKSIKNWEKLTLQMYEKQKFIKIQETQQQIQLKHYIIRKSRNKNILSIVLESSSNQVNSNSIYLRQSSTSFKQLETKLMKLWQDSQYDRINQMQDQIKSFSEKVSKKPTMELIIPENTKQAQIQQANLIKSEASMQKQTTPIFVNSENSQQKAVFNIDKTFLTDDFLNQFSSFKKFDKTSSTIYLEKGGKKVRKIFKFPESVSISQLLEVIDDIKYTRKRKQAIAYIKVLSCFPEDSTRIYREIENFEGKEIQFVYFRHYFIRQNDSYFVDKSIDVSMLDMPQESTTSKAELNYCIWRVRNINTSIELLVEADISHTDKQIDSLKLAIQYIGEFNDYFVNRFINQPTHQISSEDFENEYLSQITKLILSNEEDDFYSMEDNQFDHIEPQVLVFKKPAHIKQISMRDQFFPQATETNLLKYKYQSMPQPKKQPLYYYHKKGHLMLGLDWIENKEGFLVCVNQEKIKVQRSTMKLLIKKLGRTILSGNNIMNISMPVQIFGNDSYLYRCAKQMKFAPRFIQKAANTQDPIERMKQIACYCTGSCLTFFQLEKPFNPILGQTYQGTIDGGQIYGEQISHHPPISSIFFQGRGYKMHGSYEPKIEIGLNRGTLLNGGFTYVQFQKYSPVRLTTGSYQFLGIGFGTRMLKVSRKSYVVDENNRLFLQIVYGKNKSGRKDFGKFEDYFSGKIVKIKENVNMQNHTKIKPSDYEQEIGEFYGRINSKVFFENEELFDTSKDLPFQLVNSTPFLQSDWRFRKDIINKVQGNIDVANQMKQILQEIQRRDRKLRSEYSSQKK